MTLNLYLLLELMLNLNLFLELMLNFNLLLELMLTLNLFNLLEPMRIVIMKMKHLIVSKIYTQHTLMIDLK